MGALKITLVTVMVFLFLCAVPYTALGALVRVIRKDASWRKWAGASSKCAIAVVGLFVVALLIPSPEERDADQKPQIIPDAFHGIWASDADSCDDLNSRTRVNDDEVHFPAMTFNAQQVVSQAASEIVLRGYGTLQGTTETDTVTLRLSSDQQKLMIVVGEPSSSDAYWAKCPS